MEYVFINGKIVPAHKAQISVFDRGLVLGDGLFETLRAINYHPEFFDDHFKRLSISAKRLRIPFPFQKKWMFDLIQEICRKNGYKDASVRITLTRGEYQGGLSLPKKQPPSLIVFAKPVSGLGSDLYKKGVKVVITSINKTAASGVDPRIKSTNYLANIFAKAEADAKKAYEGILLGPGGEIAELSTSTFFCVRNGVVLTPPVDLGILPGITRLTLLRLLKKEKIPFLEQSIFPKDLPKIDEAFLTSSVRGVVPITKIDRQIIHSGIPGPLTHQIRVLYQQACCKEWETNTNPLKRSKNQRPENPESKNPSPKNNW